MSKVEEKLSKVFSQFIRLSHAGEMGYCKCFTCGKITLWRQMHCGHFRKRFHKNTKYNLKNNHPQCFECNIENDGMYSVYQQNLDEVYGEGTAQELVVLSNAICKLSEQDYAEMLKEYEIKVKQLLKRL